VQEAADNGESDEEAASAPGPEDESSETATFADAVGSLRVRILRRPAARTMNASTN